MVMRNGLNAFGGTFLLAHLWLIKIGFYIPPLRNACQSLFARLVLGTGLFDQEYYHEQNQDVRAAAMLPVLHYVAYGDQEGRSPIALFDPEHYRSQVRGRLKHVNALLHYAYIGRHRGVSPSAWFDVHYYLGQNRDIARAGVDPLLHYLRWGGAEGRSPCRQFDGAYYLGTNPDVAEAQINPLLHYLSWGRLEGRRTLPALERACPQELMPPTREAWETLRARRGNDGAKIDVIIPVYKGKIETLCCLYSVLSAASETSFDLIVINDASPDNELTEELDQLAQKGLFRLLSNRDNAGFVVNVNTGIKLHPDRDVVLLNSDTEVYPGWLDRLRLCALEERSVGTVTPLSNNATICSYPQFLQDNPHRLELDYRELDELTAKTNAGYYVEAPTGVGFCMYIRRACLDDVGLFDEAAFGKGYGEENDFCQRAVNRGWRNIVSAEVFVAHWGAASFRGEKAKRVQAALKVLSVRHPDYQRKVAEFISDDPLKSARRQLDWARLKRLKSEVNILIVSHNRGGGAERRAQEDMRRHMRAGRGVYMLRPESRQSTHVTLSHATTDALVNMPPYALSDVKTLAASLAELCIDEIHIHSLVDLVPEAAGYFVELAATLGNRLEIYLHDYEFICPRINMVDPEGKYCGEPASDYCNRCLSEHKPDFHVHDIEAWRATRVAALKAADKVLVPDKDVADRMARYHSCIEYNISPHEYISPLDVAINPPALKVDSSLRIVVIGAISKIKGFNVLLACAKDARRRGLPLQFVLMGYSMDDRSLREAGVTITGRYIDEKAQQFLTSLEPHAVWLPSLWPETYSYTYSIALYAKRPTFAFDLGAIARRMREYQSDAENYLLPLEAADQPSRINDLFCDFRAECCRAQG